MSRPARGERARRGRKRPADTDAHNDDENVAPDGKCTTAAVIEAAEQEQTFDASYVENLLEGIDSELNNRCAKIQKMADEYKEALTNAFRLKIFRVPKHVQRLKLPEYVATYGSLPFVEAARAPEVQKDDEEDEDEQTVLQTAVKGTRKKGKEKAKVESVRKSARKAKKNDMEPPSSMSASSVVAATPRATRSQIPLATPKFDPKKVTAETPGLRSLKDGEVMMSVNGSPVAIDRKVVLTAVKDQAQPERGGKGFEVNVAGDTMRLMSPSAVNKVQNDPEMLAIVIEMRRQMNQVLSEVGVSIE